MRATTCAVVVLLTASAASAFTCDCANNMSEICSGPPSPALFTQWLASVNSWAGEC